MSGSIAALADLRLEASSPAQEALPSASTPGSAELEVQCLAGLSTAITAFASSPLKLLTPRARGTSVWAYTSNFGGGLVAGDQTSLTIRARTDARCFVTTQASTKVYRNPSSRPCGHTTHAVIESNGVLVFAPDPVQAFANSIYQQRQEWHLSDSSAGLVLVDSFCAGRVAGAERWAFTRVQSRNDIFIGRERVFLDSILLDHGNSLGPSCRESRFNCFATLVCLGAPMIQRASQMLEEFSSWPIQCRSPVVFSISPLPQGAVLRLAGVRAEDVGHELRRQLRPLASLLGDDPWLRKW